MRLLLFVLAFAVSAGPAYATKIGHSSFGGAAIQSEFAPDPCGVSHSPHQPSGMLSVALRCRRLLAEWRTSPDDQVLHGRCDHIALALTDRRCSLTHT